MATKDISDLQVVEAVAHCRARDHRRTDGGRLMPQDLLIERTGQPFKVCWRALERANDRGLLDCGINLQWAWVTGKGKELIYTAWHSLDAAAVANLHPSGCYRFAMYLEQLRRDGHCWEDAERILRGFIWDESEGCNESQD